MAFGWKLSLLFSKLYCQWQFVTTTNDSCVVWMHLVCNWLLWEENSFAKQMYTRFRRNWLGHAVYITEWPEVKISAFQNWEHLWELSHTIGSVTLLSGIKDIPLTLCRMQLIRTPRICHRGQATEHSRIESTPDSVSCCLRLAMACHFMQVSMQGRIGAGQNGVLYCWL